MSPNILATVTIDDSHDQHQNENHSPTMNDQSSESPKPSKGRILYCRKCEGHGEKVILKNHSPQCPYILCNCKSCEKLNYKRLKSFNKRNKEKIELAAALNAKRHLVESSSSVDEDEGYSRRSSFCSKISTPDMDSEHNTSTTSIPTSSTCTSQAQISSSHQQQSTGLEGRSMSLGAMTVMSYDIWKAKCASEKKRLEEERMKRGGVDVSEGTSNRQSPKRSPSPTPIRKRAHTFVAQSANRGADIPVVATKKLSVDEKGKGKYILLPTIPAMRIFVNEEEEEKDQHHKKPCPKIAAPVPISVPISIPLMENIPSTSTARPFQLPQQLPRPSPVTAPPMTSPFKPVTPQSTAQFQIPQVVPNPVVTVPNTQLPSNMSTEQIISSLTLHNTVLQQQQNNQLMQGLLNTFSSIPTSTPTSATSQQPIDILSMLRLQQQAATLAAALQAAGVQVPNIQPSTSTQNLLNSFLQSQPTLYTNPV